MQLVQEVQEFINKMGDPAQFQGQLIFMSMFNDIIWRIKGNEQECIANSTFVSLFAKRSPAGRWSFLGPGSEKKRYSTCIDGPRDDDQIRRMRTPSLPSHESTVWRNAQKQRRWKIIYTLLCLGDTIETVFRTTISVYQLSIYKAVSDLCEKYSACQARTERPVLAGQSDRPIVRASKIIDNDTYTFDLNSCARKFIAKVQAATGKALATRSSDKDLY